MCIVSSAVRSQAKIIETFHLGLLAVLRIRLGEERYILKGGANIRYFFDSVRYSEDIDLDVNGVADDRFATRVDKVLVDPALGLILRGQAIRVLPADAGTGRTKQTVTTRRWRIMLGADDRRDPVRTKVEFSARNGESRFELGSVPDRVVAPYAMRPPSVQHYLLVPAAEQKVKALAGRPQTQARDVFDLELLLRKESTAGGAVPEELRAAAAEAAVELPFSAFQDQVVPFLERPVADLYDRRAWETMQHFVAGELLR